MKPGIIYKIHSSQIGGENDRLEDAMEQFSEKIEPEIRIVDQGIGHWECHGQTGFDSRPEPEIVDHGQEFFILIVLNYGHNMGDILLKIRESMKNFYQLMEFTADDGDDYPCISQYEIQHCQCTDYHHNGSVLLEVFWELER